NHFIETILPQVRVADQKLKEKLLASGLQPEGYDIALRNMRTETELFRDENVPLLTEEDKLRTEYDKIIAAQTVEWEGEERTVPQMLPVLLETDRAVRERAWQVVAIRRLADRKALNDLWKRFLTLRRQIAANADMPDYRAFIWRSLLRFDYTADDCLSFHRAIEEVVVPAATRIYEKRRARLGVETLRPWDTDVDPLSRSPLHPFEDVGTLDETTATIFHNLDPQLGEYYAIMQREGLLDLENRKGKAPGGYCTGYSYSKRPFIFMNAVGMHDDVQTLLHEGGHAFHLFESSELPRYLWIDAPTEFAEVASMSMELLGAPYLAKDAGGFYKSEDASRARIEHLEGIVLFWPYMAVVDAFQQWVYTHDDEALNPANCDTKWSELWDRFMPGIDYSDLDDVKATGWQRKLHIFQIPFYYVEYGLAQLGAVQVWHGSLSDQAKAIAAYRRALALAGTVSLPSLFTAAGAKFAMDAGTLREAVGLVERTVEQLDSV
ncbi:MAG: M3 family oligoendopeptidase, partial [Acidobacteriales bacterium]|nr:M3 family oligoendopeptidase [Terriglobales bacterium]